jgi:hypothetical protein
MNQREVCKSVKSICSKPKIIVQGYLMVNEKSINNRYYWHCELKDAKNCKGRAITILEVEEHVLKKFVKHSHAPEASCANVIQTLNIIKKTASNTNDHPVRLIQSTVTSMQ